MMPFVADVRCLINKLIEKPGYAMIAGIQYPNG